MNALLAQTDSGQWLSFFSDFSAQERFVLTLVAIGCLTAVIITCVSIVAGVWCNIRKGERENELVRDLLHQGRSAEEIEKIVRPADAWSRAWENSFCKKK